MASIDVAVPCYQYGRFLRECVSSILRQGIPDLRVLVIDNASTDDTLAVARQLAAEDSRVTVARHERNLGHLASFNEGVDWAIADYFMILCADDMLAPGSLARAISVMEKHKDVNLTFGRELVIGLEPVPPSLERAAGTADWRLLDGHRLLERLCETGRPDASRWMIAGTTAVVRTSAQKQVGHYRRQLPHTAEFDVWLRFSCIGSAAVTDAIQGIRRVHPSNRSATLPDCQAWNLHWEAAFDSFFANEGAGLTEAKRLHRMARHALAERAYWGFLSNALRGDFRLAAKLLRYAFSRRPMTMIVPPFGYLLRHHDSLERIRGAVAGVGKRWRMPAGATPPGIKEAALK